MSHQHHSHPSAKKGIHKDWRAWVVVGLMLVGILTYVLTLDDSLAPGQPPATPTPAAP